MLQTLSAMAKDSPDEKLVDITQALESIEGFSHIQALCQAEWPTDPEEAFQFEHPSFLEEGGPRRFMVDLLRALTDQKGRLMVHSGRLILERPRPSLAILREKVVISLDATPLKSLLNNIWSAENITCYGNLNYAPNAHVTQVIGRLFSAWRISEKDIEKLEAVIADAIQGYEKPLIIMPKAMIPTNSDTEAELTLNIQHSGLKLGWWGNQTRGSNDYLDSDIAILVGNYQSNPDAMRLKVNALRNTPVINAPPKETLQGMTLTGHGWLVPHRFQVSDADPLVREVMQEAQAAEYAQAIGRLRAINRGKPVKVVLINGYILKGLRIDAVQEWQDLLKDEPEKRKRPNLEQLNAEKSNQALEKLKAYLSNHPQAGRNEIARATGLSNHTVSKYLSQVTQS